MKQVWMPGLSTLKRIAALRRRLIVSVSVSVECRVPPLTTLRHFRWAQLQGADLGLACCRFGGRQVNTAPCAGVQPSRAARTQDRYESDTAD